MSAASHNQLKCELQFLLSFSDWRHQSESELWPSKHCQVSRSGFIYDPWLLCLVGNAGALGGSLCIYFVALTHSFLGVSTFFCRIITCLQGTSQPISVIENWLTFCPGQYHQGGSGMPDNKTLLPPLNQMHSLLLA